jgi:hypothetical protein
VFDARAVGGVGVNTPDEDIAASGLANPDNDFFDSAVEEVVLTTLWRRDGAIDADDGALVTVFGSSGRSVPSCCIEGSEVVVGAGSTAGTSWGSCLGSSIINLIVFGTPHLRLNPERMRSWMRNA